MRNFLIKLLLSLIDKKKALKSYEDYRFEIAWLYAENILCQDGMEVQISLSKCGNTIKLLNSDRTTLYEEKIGYSRDEVRMGIEEIMMRLVKDADLRDIPSES